MLPCLDDGSILPERSTPELVAGIEQEISSLSGHIARLARRRDALERYMAEVLSRQ